jgi:hypothetical protein
MGAGSTVEVTTLGHSPLQQAGPGLYSYDPVHLSGGLGLEQHPVPHHDPRRAQLGLASEDRAYLSSGSAYPIDRAIPFQYGADR